MNEDDGSRCVASGCGMTYGEMHGDDTMRCAEEI